MSAQCGRVTFARLSALVMLVVGCVTSQGYSQGTGKPKEYPAQKRTLVTKDNWRIAITYFQSSAGENAPVVILLHDKGGNRLVWEKGFAPQLQKNGNGYAVISVDLRKHGQSSRLGEKSSQNLRAKDYAAMVTQDLEAVKDFIFKEHQKRNLNMRKTAIVAPEMSAPIAMAFAINDWLKKPIPDAPTFETRTPRGQDIRALILISPNESLPGMSVGKMSLPLREPEWQIAFLAVHGTADDGATRKIYERLTKPRGNDMRMYLRSYKSKLRGTALVKPATDIEAHMIAFLELHLKELTDEWRDRKGRL